MKKYLMILIALVGFGFSAKAADGYYKVTFDTKIVFEYYDEGGNVVGYREASGGTRTVFVCSRNEGQARNDGMYECSSQCQRDNKYEGYQTYNGKSYKCYSKRTVSSVVSITRLRDC